MKGPSPLLGFNNNVKHKGRVFHIQTEDSGVNHPHIITHLFADGGRILKTKKTSYAEHVGEGDMARTVRTMMQDQHKAMFIALRGGHFDHLLDGLERPSPRDTLPDVSPTSEPEVASPRPAPSTRDAAAASARTEPALGAAAIGPSPLGTEGAPTSAAAAVDRSARPASSPEPSRAAEARPDPPAPPSPPPAAPRPSAGRSDPGEGIELDLDALERAAQEAQTPVFKEIHNLPPPPAAVLGANRRVGVGTTAYRSVTPVSQTTMPAQSVPLPPAEHPTTPSRGTVLRGSSTPPRPSSSPGEATAISAGGRPGSSAPRAPSSSGGDARRSDPDLRAGSDPGARGGDQGRYAPSRPASIFGSSRPAEGASIFGEELISEKSLDEVILSYLAEDLEGPPPKK